MPESLVLLIILQGNTPKRNKEYIKQLPLKSYMAIQYKQKCTRCRTNYVTVTRRQPFPVCEECQKKEMSGEITDPKMKEMFDIPEEFYKKSNFLRSIKVNYLRFGSLSEKQIDAFKNTVKNMKEKKDS
ncbi:MAG: hypothetical protein KKE98_00500 [Nanoarchaeota archaeon]|nr:hypothetical protein [Nanoarchaeota archaeon]